MRGAALVFSCLLIALVATTSCNNSGVSSGEYRAPTNTESSYSTFKRRLDAGANCAELFRIRNAMDPKSPDIEQINEDLRGIGCYSPDSIRTDLSTTPQGAQKPTEAPALAFTVKEYRIYRAVIDTPMSVPEAQALQNVATKYGVSVEEVSTITDKVMDALSRNRWFGTAKSEIRHASDWSPNTP